VWPPVQGGRPSGDARAPAGPASLDVGRGHGSTGGRAYNRAVTAPDTPRTWILTGSPENFEATRERGFLVVGLKERRRAQALQIVEDDRIVFYLTRVMRFGASVRVTGPLFEDRTPIWPGKPGRPDPYPWRLPTEPEIVLEEPEWIEAETLAPELEHARKWPHEHWRLAFQGQIRPVSDADAGLLVDRLHAAAGVRA